MKYGTLPGVSKPVARLAQGTTMLDGAAPDNILALLDGVLATGGNLFDAAHVYRGGESERMLGRWVRARGVREQVVIVTKGAHPNADRVRVTPFDITSDLHDSLARLQT